MFPLNASKIAVIGLGYVGLPLAVEFGKSYSCVGYDVNEGRICELQKNNDVTLETTAEELSEAENLSFTTDSADLDVCNVYVVTVPTPIDDFRRPDLTFLIRASEVVGKSVSTGDIVIFESTVYPGATEDDCVPVIERESGLILNRDFFVGYSPERINPGDKTHKLPDIKKVVSGSTPEVADFIDGLYRSIIPAGTHKASSIKVAEAAKIIENAQRDLNIALMNELAIIFNKLEIDTSEVLEAAKTKWNFLPFHPGLVGGHCIGVDPYYLTHKAEQAGYHPEIILAGRQLNDRMHSYVANRFVKEMLRRGIEVSNARVLVLGIAFKENCPDVRNSKVVDLVGELQEFSLVVDVCDPWVSQDCFDESEIRSMISGPISGAYDGVILAVPHNDFVEMGPSRIRSFGREKHVFFDLKSAFAPQESDVRL